MLRDLKFSRSSMNLKFPIQPKMKISEKQILNKFETINAENFSEHRLNYQDFFRKNIKNSTNINKENIFDNRVFKNEGIINISLKNEKSKKFLNNKITKNSKSSNNVLVQRDFKNHLFTNKSHSVKNKTSNLAKKSILFTKKVIMNTDKLEEINFIKFQKKDLRNETLNQELEIERPKSNINFKIDKISTKDVLNFQGIELINEVFCKLSQNSEFKESLKSLEILNSLNFDLNGKILTINSSEDGVFKKENTLFSEIKSFSNNFSKKDSSRINITLDSRIKETLNLNKQISEINESEKSLSHLKNYLNSMKISILPIYHDSTFKKIWDQSIFLLILYTVSITPIYLCFFENQNFFKFFEIFIELQFIIDFILNLFSTFLDDNEIRVTKLSLIVENYVFSWFLLDLLILCPFDTISSFFPNNYIFFTVQMNYIIKFTLFKWIKMFRLIKLFKIQTTGKFISKIVLNDNYTLNRVFKFVFLFLILSHIASCFFIFIGFTTLNDLNWINYSNLSEYSNFDLYIASLYYMLVTIFTVGYGDILPINIWEKLTMIVFMFVGSMLYSYAVSSLSTIFSEKNTKYIEYKRKISVLNSIDEENQLPTDLYHNLKQNIKIEYKKNEIEKFEFLDSLPSNNRNDLIFLMYESTIKKHKFFYNQPNNFILFVLPLLKFHKVRKDDILISVGEIIDEMYFILNGFLSLNLESNFDNYEISLIKEGNHFGDLLIQTNESCPYELKCKSDFSDLLVLKKSDFLKIKLLFIDNIHEIFEESLIDLEIFNRKRQLIIEMFKNGESSKDVKKKMIQLNIYLMYRGFEEYFENDTEFEDINDFFFNYDLKSLKFLFDSLNDLKFIMKGNETSSDIFNDSLDYNTKDGSKKTIKQKRNYNRLSKNFKKMFSNHVRLSSPKVKYMTKSKTEKKSFFDEISFNSKNNIEDVFKKYYGRINKKINPLNKNTIKREKKFNNRIIEVIRSKNMKKEKFQKNNSNIDFRLENLSSKNSNNSFDFSKEDFLSNKIKEETKHITCKLKHIQSDSLFEDKDDNLTPYLNPTSSHHNKNLETNFIKNNLNKSLNFIFEDTQVNKIKFEDKNFFMIEKTVDIHLIYNREKQNLNYLANFTKDILIQTQSFTLQNNSVHSELIISEAKNDFEKKIISLKRDSIASIDNKKAIPNQKQMLINNNSFLRQNLRTNPENNEKIIMIQELSSYNNQKILYNNVNKKLNKMLKQINNLNKTKI